MTVETFIPPPPLNRFIGFFLFYEGLNPPHEVDRFLPDGNTELLIDLAEQKEYHIALMDWKTKAWKVLTDSTYKYHQAPVFVRN